MNTIPVMNRLKFKNVVYRRTGDLVLGFVTCIDVQSNGKGTGEKHYWGKLAFEGDREGVIQIIKTGGKWDGFDDDGRILF